MRRLAHKTPDGTLKPPGAGVYGRWIDDDNRELLIVAEGDAFEVFVGQDPSYVRFHLSVPIAMVLMKWLFRWWVSRSFFGLVHYLWDWALNTIYDEEAREREKLRLMSELPKPDVTADSKRHEQDQEGA